MQRHAFVFVLLLAAACRYDPPGQCQSIADCQPGERCSSGLCLTDCDTDLDCAAWERCTGKNGDCVALSGSCNRPSDCEYWEKCSPDHFCVAAGESCSSDSVCQEWEHCSEVGVCLAQSGRCSTASDCPLTTDACVEGHVCVDSTSSTSTSGSTDATGTSTWTQEILIVGTVTSSIKNTQAIAPLDSPEKVSVGFGPNLYLYHAALTPGGSLYYLDRDQSPYRVRKFVADEWKWSQAEGISSWVYPVNPTANDPVVDGGACPADTSTSSFMMQAGNGKIMQSCGSWGLTYKDSTGRVVVADQNIAAWNSHDYMLAVVPLGIIDPSRNVKPVVGLDKYAPYHAVRCDGDGFLLALKTSPVSLWRINKAGQSTKVRTYGEREASPCDLNGCALDRAGALYCQTCTADRISVILKYNTGGQPAEIVYSKSEVPAGANNLKNKKLFLYTLPGFNFVTAP